LKAGDLAGAVAAYSEAIAANPRDTRGWTNRSLVYMKQGAVLAAFMDAYHVTRGLDASNGKGWLRLGDANITLELYAAAVMCYKMAAHASDGAALRAEAAARMQEAMAAVKTAGWSRLPVGICNVAPPGADRRQYSISMSPSPDPGMVQLPAAYRAGPGGPRHPDTVLAALRDAASTDAVQLAAIPGKGIGMVARRALPVHTVVHAETPLLAVAVRPLGGAAHPQCYHCARRLPSNGGVPCDCDGVFCSDVCKATAVRHYHAALCSVNGGRADAVLEEATATDPYFVAHGFLLPWKLLGWALTAAAATGTPPVSPADLPPFCYLHRPTDLAAPGAPSTPAMYVHGAPLAVAWSTLYGALGKDAPLLMQMPPSWLLEALSLVVGNALTVGGDDGTPEVTVLAHAGSYFNHSCVRNTVWDTAATGPRATFITTRPLAAGEELTVTYTGDFTGLMARLHLRIHYNFRCVCTECAEEARLAAAGGLYPLTPRQRYETASHCGDTVAQFAALTDVIAAEPNDPIAWALRAKVGFAEAGGALRAYCDAYHVTRYLDPFCSFAWLAEGCANEVLDQYRAAVVKYKRAAALETVAADRKAFERLAESAAARIEHGWVPPAHPLECARVVGAAPRTLPLPSAFRAGPGGPRRLDTVLAAVADTRSSDWVRFEVVPGKGVGVVAARDIPAGTVVHVEKPVLAATLLPAGALICYHCLVPVSAATAVPCACDRMFCSAACKTTALQHYHAATCGAGGGRADATLEELARTDSEFGMRALLLPWKLLGWALTAAKAARAPATSPADLPPFCYMDRTTDLGAPPPRVAPAAPRAHTSAHPFLSMWSWFHDMLRGDTVMARMAPEWLLETIMVIYANAVSPLGKLGDVPQVQALARGAACFNHSCEPNAAFVMDLATTGSQVTVVTSRPVAAGEEVTVSYVDAAAPYATRAELLHHRGFTCTCRRCLIDEREKAARGGPAGSDAEFWKAVNRRALPPLPAAITSATAARQAGRRGRRR